MAQTLAQPDLFSAPPPRRKPLAEIQTEEKQRVSDRIAGAIVAFWLAREGEFHVEELRAYVERVVGKTAPASADRILRDLRQRKVINYVVVSRSQSLYRALPLEDER